MKKKAIEPLFLKITLEINGKEYGNQLDLNQYLFNEKYEDNPFFKIVWEEMGQSIIKTVRYEKESNKKI